MRRLIREPVVDQVISQGLGVLASAAVLALIAVGLAVSFGLMRIINLAHGEFVMLGAYAAVLAAGHGISWEMGLIAAAACGLAMGALAEITVVGRVYRSPELSILGTFGISIVLRQTVEVLFGKGYRATANPFPGVSQLLGVSFPTYRLALLIIAAVVLGAVLAGLHLTPLGLRVRAVATDRTLAETIGIRSTRLNLLVFAASTALAALAGALVAPITNVQPEMGLTYLFGAFLVVIVCGGRVWAVLAAALAIAVVQNLTTFFVDSLTGRIAVLLLAFLILQRRRMTFVGARA